MIIPEELNAISKFIKECGWDIEEWNQGSGEKMGLKLEDWFAYITKLEEADLAILLVSDLCIIAKKSSTAINGIKRVLFSCSICDPKCFDGLKKTLDEI